MRLILFILCFSITSFSAISQPGPPGDPGGGSGNPTVPITGIEILVGIGGLLGASRFLKNKNNSKGN
jgi:hypothetical protein